MSRRRTAAMLMSAALFIAASPQQQLRKVTVEAERFAFTPSRIRVAVGEEIEIHLRSADTAHGFEVQGTEINVTIPKRGRGEQVVTFKGDKPGRFTFECNRMCGAGHHFMRGEIVVVESRE